MKDTLLKLNIKDHTNEFHSSAEVYNNCIGPDQETDWENYCFGNLPSQRGGGEYKTMSHFDSLPHIHKLLISHNHVLDKMS